MLSKDYSIMLYSPLGVKRGLLIFNTDGSMLSGELKILNSSCVFVNGTSDNGKYEFSCALYTLIGYIFFDVHMYEKNNKLYGMVSTNRGCMAVTGEKIANNKKSEVGIFNEQK